jgi:signal transduction histidine kinase
MTYAGGGSGGVRGPVNLSHAVEESLRLFRATLLKNVVLTVNLDAKLPPICAEVGQIRQIVMNLLTNAQESLPNLEGSIGVSTSSVMIHAESAALESLPPGKYVRLEVTDTGHGIDEASRLRIFDPFYTTKSLGRGLGLSAVQGIVRSLGGMIRVQSIVGRGSAFEILIPIFNAGATG